MKKIPTIFVRNTENMKNVTDKPNPICDWVFAGEGTATRKYDGTCIMYDGKWWARREVGKGKQPPPNYRTVVTDAVTGKAMGWEPIEQSSFYRHFLDALYGTHELMGPKINGNPEGLQSHAIIKHDVAEVFDDIDRSYEGIKKFMVVCRNNSIEGIVFHHPDGRMAKIKAKDFE